MIVNLITDLRHSLQFSTGLTNEEKEQKYQREALKKEQRDKEPAKIEVGLGDNNSFNVNHSLHGGYTITILFNLPDLRILEKNKFLNEIREKVSHTKISFLDIEDEEKFLDLKLYIESKFKQV